MFGFAKTRNQWLARNARHLFVSCAQMNRAIAKKPLVRPSGGVYSPVAPEQRGTARRDQCGTQTRVISRSNKYRTA